MNFTFQDVPKDVVASMRMTSQVSPNGLIKVGVDSSSINSMSAYIEQNGVRTSILTPAAWTNPTIAPQIFGVNDLGQVIGIANFNGVYQGFVWQNGVVSSLNFPGSQETGFNGVNSAGTASGLNTTRPIGINNHGQVVGGYNDAAGQPHSFLWQNGTFTEIATPDQGVGTCTSIWGITDQGVIFGQYGTFLAPGQGLSHAFVTDPTQGTQIAATTMPDNYGVTDTSQSISCEATGENYVGPVAGITTDIILLNGDNMNVTSHSKNSFIHTGSGTDAIDVSAAGGNNILDGSTGSNFLVGGAGHDTFFVDDRAASTDIWSTVAGFHAGDAVTVWGVASQDFDLSWVDNQGAKGFQGITLHATSFGPTASVSLAGFTTADLNDGKLSVSFGRTAYQDGLAGSNYMQIRGN